MDDVQQLEQVAQRLIGSYGWMAVLFQGIDTEPCRRDTAHDGKRY